MIVLYANVDCASCGATYVGVWEIDADTVQDLDEVPATEQECSGCEHKQLEEWPGWTSYTEAGLLIRWENRMAKPIRRNDQLASMPGSYINCRVVIGNHVPAAGYPVINRTRDGGYETMFVCDNCGTEVRKYRDRHGFVTGKRGYKYESGYLIAEGGRLTASEKSALFLGMATGSPVKFGKGRRSA